MSKFSDMILLIDICRMSGIDTTNTQDMFIGQIDFVYQFRKGRKLMEPYMPVLMDRLDQPPPRQGPSMFWTSQSAINKPLDKIPLGEFFRSASERGKAMINLSDAMYYNRRRNLFVGNSWGRCFLERISRASNHHDT